MPVGQLVDQHVPSRADRLRRNRSAVGFLAPRLTGSVGRAIGPRLDPGDHGKGGGRRGAKKRVYKYRSHSVTATLEGVTMVGPLETAVLLALLIALVAALAYGVKLLAKKF